MIETIKTFIAQHEAAITDLAFITGYLLTLIAVTILILFFCLRYIRKHQKPDEKMIKGYTTTSLLQLFDCFTYALIFYAAVTMGIKIGLKAENQIIFNAMPPFIFSLASIPFVFLAFFCSLFMNDKLVNKMSGGMLYLYNRLKKRGDKNDDIESTDIPDIPDSDTGGGTPDRSLHHDRHGTQYADKRGKQYMNKIDELFFKLRGRLFILFKDISKWIDDFISGK
ncbi:MAG: hypothetical protein K2N98_00730 [Lachnospiraceae bacterium]|nr:hypothetical protein [Lachnospiraceae bacterium]